MKRISVIVPVHNAAEYLETCIDSILAQTYTDLELILIEDASGDESGAICDKYAAGHENVKVFHQKNGSAGRSRNAGLEIASGEYVAFVDADDYLADEAALWSMAEEMEKGYADVVVGNYERLWDGKLLKATGHETFSGNDRESGTFRFQGFFSVGTLSYVWAKLYRRSFLRDHGLSFRPYSYAEDKLFNFCVYSEGARYGYVSGPVYVYRKNDSSVSWQYRADSAEGWMRMAGELYGLLEKKGLEKTYGDLVADTLFFAAFFDGKAEYIHHGNSMKAVKELLKKYGEDPLANAYFRQFAKGRGLKHIPSFLWKMMIWGFSFGMRFRWYGLLAFGVRLLVDLRIDQMLSDTGKREK